MKKGRRTKVKLRRSIVSNGGDVIVNAVLGGNALALLPSFLAPQEAQGVEPILLDWSAGHRRVYAVYPHRRFVPSKVRVFVDFMREALGDSTHDPWWPRAFRLPGA